MIGLSPAVKPTEAIASLTAELLTREGRKNPRYRYLRPSSFSWQSSPAAASFKVQSECLDQARSGVQLTLGRFSAEEADLVPKDLASDLFFWLPLQEGDQRAGYELKIGENFSDSRAIAIEESLVAPQGLSARAHVRWRLGRNANALIVQDRRVAAPFATVLHQIDLEPGARLKWIRVGESSGAAGEISRDWIRIGEGAQCEIVSIFVGNRDGQTRAQHRLFAEFLGRGGVIKAQSAFAGAGMDQFEWCFDALHNQPETQSQVGFYTALAGKSRGVFSGNVRVTREGRGSRANQKNRNLLLSPKAEADPNPKLEIETDEVECSHGATVSCLDEQQVYYLQTRGISRSDAEQLLVAGFFSPVIESLPSPVLARRLEQKLAKQLNLSVGDEKWES